jgi:putative mRNA 3-end processing factor
MNGRLRPDALLHPRPEGLYCPPGDFYIDPVRPVPRALITHGHSDHARAGHGHVLATRQTLDIMAIRLGAGFAGSVQAAGSDPIIVDGVNVAFTPAGHVLGSAQVTVAAGGTRITVTGDYKRGADSTVAEWQPAPCEVLVTEATFGLPVFRHPDPRAEIARLLASVGANPDRAHLVGVYALGKAQRVIRLIREAGHDGPLFIHGSLARLCDYYVAEGVDLGDLRPATSDAGRAAFAGAIVLGPPSAFAATWAQRFPDPVICFASGWMGVRARIRQRGVELPLVISDHVDWPELTATVTELAPAEVWVTHGREEALVRWCQLQGIAARPLNLVGYEDEPD